MSNKTVSMVKAKPERLNIGKAKPICKTQPTHKTQPIKKTKSSRKEQLVRKIESTDKIESMYKSVVISPNSAGGRSIKTAPAITNQKRKLKSVFGFQSQADILKTISPKALLPLGYSHSNRFYLT